MLLTKAGVNFIDNRIPFDKWPTLKASMPGEQVPCLEILAEGSLDSTLMGESLEIFKLVAEKHGFIPEGYQSDVEGYLNVWKTTLEALSGGIPFTQDEEQKA